MIDKGLVSVIYTDLRECMKGDRLFNIIDIETTAYCNFHCWYCPNSVYDRGSDEWSIMPMKMYKKIIDDLSTFKFSGTVRPFLYGEPLLDKHLFDRLVYTRQRLPNCNIHLSTNGTNFTQEAYDRLSMLCDSILVTKHPECNYEFCNIKENELCTLTVREIDRLQNRGGLLKIDGIRRRFCSAPSRIMTVNFLGDIILCCNDYHGRVVFGNVMEQHILKTWCDLDYQVERGLLRKGKVRLNICKSCTWSNDIGKVIESNKGGWTN